MGSKRSIKNSATLGKHQSAAADYLRHPGDEGPPLGPCGQSPKQAGGPLELWVVAWAEPSDHARCLCYPKASFLLTKESLQCFICLTISSVACVRENGRQVDEQ